MSKTLKGRANLGAYESPFSGVGIEFFPLGIQPDRSGLTLHETGYDPNNTDWNFPSVFSPFWRLIYNRKRGHCIAFGEEMVEILPDHVVLIPDHFLFHCLGHQGVPCFWQSFSFTKTLHESVTVPVLLPARDTEECLIRDLEALVEKNTNWEPTDAIFRNSVALLHIVLAREELKWRSPMPAALEDLKAFIEGNVATVLSNALLAKQANMSVAALHIAFKQHFGTTPAKYVNQVRIRDASRRLLQTDDSIDNIAEATGFQNRNHFSRVFRNITGEPPAAFRRHHRR